MLIKVISLWEPWATAMARKLKKNETRCWPISYRGWLGIQAAKKEYRPRDYDFPFNQMVQGAGIWPHHLVTTYGKLLCIVKLVGCEKTGLVREAISEAERNWGNYADQDEDTGKQRFAWITSPADLIKLPEPIPIRGRQGLFDLEIDASLFPSCTPSAPPREKEE